MLLRKLSSRMKARKPLGLALGLVCLAALSGCPIVDDPPSSFVVSAWQTSGSDLDGATSLVVTVRNALTGARVSGATVKVEGAGTATANSSGEVVFNGLVGPVTITAGGPGFDLATIVGVNASGVTLGITPRVVGRATIILNVSGLAAGDVVSAGGNFLIEGDRTTAAGATATLQISVLSNARETVVIHRVPAAGGQSVEITQPLAFPGSSSITTLAVDFTGITNTLAFGAAGSITAPAAVLGGTFVAGASGANGDGVLGVPFLTGRFGEDFVTGSVTEAYGATAARSYNFALANLAGTSNFLLLNVETNQGGVRSFAARAHDLLTTTLPAAVLASPPSPVAPAPGGVAGITSDVTWVTNGIVDATNGVLEVHLTDEANDSEWVFVVRGDRTTFAIPDLSGTPLSGLGLRAGDAVEVSVTGVRYDNFPGFDATDFDALELNRRPRTLGGFEYGFTAQ